MAQGAGAGTDSEMSSFKFALNVCDLAVTGYDEDE